MPIIAIFIASPFVVTWQNSMPQGTKSIRPLSSRGESLQLAGKRRLFAPFAERCRRDAAVQHPIARKGVRKCNTLGDPYGTGQEFPFAFSGSYAFLAMMLPGLAALYSNDGD
ncbi:hypothetical protein FBT96_05085 [Rhodobacter capsulatus]|uniref:Uncharacterized protein n=1 Tax=Rhodobacter capsulatus TaxID=1061 RepID=A0A4U1JUC1_RHOCA|nr:hypothetical protein [Rhodobacter capsulatus]TKD22842.1 hypothetical protein FBT96_05085 [Rhodobacter capsulatus]